MEAVTQSEWGNQRVRETLSVSTVPKPTPAAGEILVKVHAVSLNAGDYHAVTGRPYIIRPAIGFANIPGMDFSGVVEQADPNCE